MGGGGGFGVFDFCDFLFLLPRLWSPVWIPEPSSSGFRLGGRVDFRVCFCFLSIMFHYLTPRRPGQHRLIRS